MKSRLKKLENDLAKRPDETQLLERNIQIKQFEAELEQYETERDQLMQIKKEREREESKMLQSTLTNKRYVRGECKDSRGDAEGKQQET